MKEDVREWGEDKAFAQPPARDWVEYAKFVERSFLANSGQWSRPVRPTSEIATDVARRLDSKVPSQFKSIRDAVFLETATRVRKNGGLINKVHLRNYAFHRIWNKRWNVDIDVQDATLLAHEVVERLVLSWDASKYRPATQMSAASRENRLRAIAERHYKVRQEGSCISLRALASEFGTSKSTVQRAIERFRGEYVDSSTIPILLALVELLVPSDARRILFADTLEERLQLEIGESGGPHLPKALQDLRECQSKANMSVVEYDADSALGPMLVVGRGRSKGSDVDLRVWAEATESRRILQRAPSRPSQLRYGPPRAIAAASPSRAMSVAVAVLAVSEDVEDMHLWMTFYGAYGEKFVETPEFTFDKACVRNRLAGAFRQGHRQGLDSVSALVGTIRHVETRKLVGAANNLISTLQVIDQDRPDLILKAFDDETRFSSSLDDVEAQRWQRIMLWLGTAQRTVEDALTILPRRDALRCLGQGSSAALVDTNEAKDQIIAKKIEDEPHHLDDPDTDFGPLDHHSDDVRSHQFSASGYSPLLDDEGYIYGPDESDDDE